MVLVSFIKYKGHTIGMQIAFEQHAVSPDNALVKICHAQYKKIVFLFYD